MPYLLYISDFHNLKIVNKTFLSIFEGGLIFLSRGVYIYVQCIYIKRIWHQVTYNC